MGETNKSTELVEFLAKAIVSEPEDVKAKVSDDGVIELETDDDDRGRVIGRQGRVAKALRAVLGASRHGRDARLEIVD
ncbi:MAG: KH domain-containing protein [Myxococcota bacterium]|nr:KH domain-containing protein [Myxococcota bacterium]